MFSIVLFAACKPAADKGNRPLYEILTQQSTGGAQVQFYEILTESKEITMLQNDENLRRKIDAEDIKRSNFIILNAGEQSSGGHSITVDKVEETPDKIIVTVRKEGPKPGEMALTVISYPYTIVRINSKKPIEIK